MAAHKEDLVSTLESSLQVIKRLGPLPELSFYICVFKVRNLFSRRRVYLCYLSLIMWRKMARKPMSTKAVSSYYDFITCSNVRNNMTKWSSIKSGLTYL